MAIKLETLTFQRDGNRKLNRKLSVVPESKRHSIHDMFLTENFQPSIKRLLHDEPLQLEPSKSTSILSLSDTKAYTNVVSFLKTSATSTKNRLSTSSGSLIRSKTKSKQSINRKKRQTSPTSFLQDIPQSPPNIDDMNFFNLLLATMQSGGYITPNLYISKDLWYQPNIRFTAIDTKISICESIRDKLQNLSERTIFSDSISIEQDLTVLEITLKDVDRIIKRKLWNPILQETEQPKKAGDQRSVTGVSTRRSAYFEAKTTQTIHQWGNRLSKSVDKIKFETNQSEQNSIYIQHLIDIFTLAKLFDTWKVQLTNKNDLEHLQICLNLFISVMNKFVIKDYELLLDKWLCQSMNQFLDL